MRRMSWALIATSWGLLHCAATPKPCTGADTCGGGQECLANRCVALGSEPVAESGSRSIARVTEMAVIASDLDYSSGLPTAVSFGAQRVGTVELLLRFEPIWRRSGRIEQAFLLLDPLPKGRTSAATINVDVWRVEEAWSKSELSWLAQPELGHPKAEGIASANNAPLRVDVTQLVRYLQRFPEKDHGLAMRAAGHDAAGVSYATGVGGGKAPRIEVYAR